MRRIGSVVLAVTIIAAASVSAQGGGRQPSTQSSGADYAIDVYAARALANEGRPKEALAVAQRAIRRDSSRWEGYAAAAEAYLAQGLLDDAIGQLQLAIARAPEVTKAVIRNVIASVRSDTAVTAPVNTRSPASVDIRTPGAEPGTIEVPAHPLKGMFFASMVRTPGIHRQKLLAFPGASAAHAYFQSDPDWKSGKMAMTSVTMAPNDTDSGGETVLVVLSERSFEKQSYINQDSFSVELDQKAMGRQCPRDNLVAPRNLSFAITRSPALLA
jgi:tetratricopeptide (TPR) repeat protein